MLFARTFMLFTQTFMVFRRTFYMFGRTFFPTFSPHFTDGREKNAFTTVLKQIAFMRDNTYHLHQHMWNDVNDEWPYYTEQEKQLLKR